MVSSKSIFVDNFLAISATRYTRFSTLDLPTYKIEVATA